ncbi:MAG: repeat protein, partial [Deltaproteobacteria bacterium]|nr:repeat protein [Deltaproteobacteria bacterium]
MSRRRKIAVAVAIVMVTGLLFTAFVLPLIVRGQLEQQIGSATDRQCTVNGVAINPLNWSAEVRGLKLSEKNSKALFVSFSSVKLRVSPTSLWRLAPVVAELKVTSPYLHLERTAANSYNFSDILAKNSSKKSDKPASFSLNNIVVENGRVAFDDNALSRPAKHTVEQLSLQIPFISNISYFADKYVDPKLSANVNGAHFDFAGKMKPFEKGLEASLSINLQGINIPYYAPYFPQELPVQIRKGILSTALNISHRLIQGGKPDITITGLAGVKELDIQEKSGAALFSLAAVNIDIKRLALLTRSYEITSLSIAGPHLYLHGDKDGIWNLSRLARKESAAPATAEPPAVDSKTAKAAVYLQTLRLTDGRVTLQDDRPPGGNAAEFREVTLNLDNFATQGELPAAYTLSLKSGRNETAAASGSIVMEPLAVSARIALTDIVHEAYYPYLLHILAAPVRGRIDCRGDLAYSAATGLTLDQVMLRLKEVKAPFGKVDGANLPLIVAEGGSLNVHDRTLAFAKVTSTGGTVNLSRDPAGRLSTNLLLREKSPAAETPRKEAGKPFSWKIGSAAVKGLKLAFTDGTREDSPRFEFGINAGLTGITGPKLAAMPLNLRVTYGAKGALTARGRLKASPLGFNGELAISSFPFVDFDAYLPAGVNITLLDGKLDTKLSLDLAMQEKKLTGSFRGEGGIRDFYSVDAEEEEDLLKWESLHFDKFSGTVDPFTLQMNGLSLNNYYARVIVNKNGRINFQDIYRPAVKAQSAADPAARTEATPPARKIQIDAITFSDGTLDFSDYHLNRNFSTTMLNLGGRVSGLSSADGSAADVDLRGNLENHSPLKIAGRINPLASNLFLDMQIVFSDIELSPLTPYSGTYLGYAIDKGKLSLTLKYKVEQKKLTAENKVFIDQFTFGEAVESPKATSLPVRLAVALLKDRNGEIHLDLPLSGRTDAPEFSVWGLIGQVLKNLLVKAATAPLALLQASFGGGADFSAIAFASGSSRLSAGEEEKLRSLAKALTERPGIRLEVAGFADRERDPEGFRSELLLKKMKSEKFLSLAKEKRESAGLSHDAVEIPVAEQSKWLKAVYEKEK